ncbi:MAG: hypothetical protein IPK85_05215 [Gemmatimonadetes bacterium]|nr:hypothetical protein [Gemmatimonadota bacterium]
MRRPDLMCLALSLSVAAPALAQVADSQRPGIAVLDFKNIALINHADYEPLRGGFSDFLSRHLHRSHFVRTAERSNIDKIIIELDMPPERMDPATMARAGLLLAARYVVVGGFLVDRQNHVSIEARAVDVQTSQVVRTVNVRGSAKRLMALIEELGDSLVRALDLPPLPSSDDGARRPENYSAVFRDRADVVLQLLSLAKYAKARPEARADAYRKFLALTEPDLMPEDRAEAVRWLSDHTAAKR